MSRSLPSFVAGVALGLASASGLAVAGPGFASFAGLVPYAQSATSQVVEAHDLANEVRDPYLRRALQQATSNALQDLGTLSYELEAAQVPVTRPAPRPGFGRPDVGRPDRPGRPVRPAPAPRIAMGDVLSALDAEPFSDGKLSTLRSIAAHRCFTTGEVVQVMNAFTFDRDKVEAAALLYRTVEDPERWFQVYPALTFSSSRDDLRRRTA